MYSLMSSWISESSSPNRNSARVLDSSVLPTPDGPAKMNDPPGRLGSFRPARVRRIAWDSALIASFWPMTRRCSSSSIRSSRCDSSSVSLNTGIAVGQLGRSDQRAVRDGHAVVGLVPVAQALEDLDGVRDRRLGHLDGLEPALERGVLLQVLAVLIQRGGADGLQLAAGQHRLQYRGRVDRALGRARPDEGVDLVDEQDDVAAGADLLEHHLEPILEDIT